MRYGQRVTSRSRTLLLVLSGLLVAGAITAYRQFLANDDNITPYPIFSGADAARGELPGPEIPHAELPATKLSPETRLPLATKLFFVSDTQAPLLIERVRLQADGNEQATAALFSLVAAAGPPSTVFHLGDITAMGSSGTAWQRIDRELEKLRQARVDFYPALGNHEYMIAAGKGKASFFARFPYAEPGWYVTRRGGVAVVLLNSNFTHLGDDERAAQREWYAETLRTLEADAAVRAILVGCHHAPYTNSEIVDPCEEVQRFFVPLYLRHSKCKLFLSGHAHAFEHFVIEGKDFVVIGGAGGLLHPLLQGEDRRWNDRYPEPLKRRFFHYFECTFPAEGLLGRVLKIDPHSTGAVESYRLVIPY
ncbi:MAG: metallophosphoesterase [Planctomycetota bacterium]